MRVRARATWARERERERKSEAVSWTYILVPVLGCRTISRTKKASEKSSFRGKNQFHFNFIQLRQIPTWLYCSRKFPKSLKFKRVGRGPLATGLAKGNAEEAENCPHPKNLDPHRGTKDLTRFEPEFLNKFAFFERSIWLTQIADISTETTDTWKDTHSVTWRSLTRRHLVKDCNRVKAHSVFWMA